MALDIVIVSDALLGDLEEGGGVILLVHFRLGGFLQLCIFYHSLLVVFPCLLVFSKKH